MSDKLIDRDRYGITNRQINRVKGYEVSFAKKGDAWPVSLGWFKTLKEARQCVAKHKELIC